MAKLSREGLRQIGSGAHTFRPTHLCTDKTLVVAGLFQGVVYSLFLLVGLCCVGVFCVGDSNNMKSLYKYVPTDWSSVMLGKRREEMEAYG